MVHSETEKKSERCENVNGARERADTYTERRTQHARKQFTEQETYVDMKYPKTRWQTSIHQVSPRSVSTESASRCQQTVFRKVTTPKLWESSFCRKKLEKWSFPWKEQEKLPFVPLDIFSRVHRFTIPTVPVHGIPSLTSRDIDCLSQERKEGHQDYAWLPSVTLFVCVFRPSLEFRSVFQGDKERVNFGCEKHSRAVVRSNPSLIPPPPLKKLHK